MSASISPRGVKLAIGAFYTTTDPICRVVRVISNRLREVDKDFNECGGPTGYWCQVVDGRYHAPFKVDKFGCWNDDKGQQQMIQSQVAPAAEKYIIQ